MVKLYYSPGACSLAPHIVITAAGLKAETEKAQLGSAEYKAVNPKGYVPALRLDDGSLLTEAQVIMQYLADQNPGAHLLPAAGTLDRYRVQEWLAFISTEIHKGAAPLFNKQLTPEQRSAIVDKLRNRLDYLNTHLGAAEYLHNNTFSIADIYLFTILNWKSWLGLESVIEEYPNVATFYKRVAALPAVHETLKAEGLAQ